MENHLRELIVPTSKHLKLKKEIDRLSKQKKLTNKQSARLALRIKQNEPFEKKIHVTKLAIIRELKDFEVGLGTKKEDKTVTRDHNRAYQKVKEMRDKAFEEVKKLKERAMPDLPMDQFTGAGVLAEMKNRNLDKGSINVDVHYEPNQFGLHGEDMDTLRKDALPNSLKTFAMFPDQLSKKQKAVSGELHGVDALKTKLGIPLKDLSQNPWLNGSGFAKKKEFHKSATELSGYYATWLKEKEPSFKDSAFVDDAHSKIPFKVRVDQLKAFLKENNVAPARKDEFMKEVVHPWASQSMIAHIMSSDFDNANADVSLGSAVPSQDFSKMRADLPIKRSE